ncbi:C26 family cysteine hydrolase domain-containing family [Roseomonas frigidaquae]|uniref:C26 family cysteine hydrolase domain-containing family n=1 Tax=Falsiroseomonas frigidaquae TaxID=487318 RepID=A0ABX1F5L4_9PROT|nr:C26 family cysteine hydrolase domain-containing family [Falsiroseomonas frigidaquae]
MKVLILRNSETAPEGALGDWLAAQGHALEVVSGADVTPGQMQDAALVVMLGSPHGLYQTEIPWIAAQRPMVAARLAARKPTIGICFGAQMMAAAAGGEVARHPDGRFFRGWLGIEDTADPALSGPWPRWHGDVITPPPGAEVIARDAGTVQAFRLPNAIAVQFHPEATPELLQSWAALSPPGAVDAGALAADSARLFPARAAARDALFAALLRQAGA